MSSGNIGYSEFRLRKYASDSLADMKRPSWLWTVCLFQYSSTAVDLESSLTTIWGFGPIDLDQITISRAIDLNRA